MTTTVTLTVTIIDSSLSFWMILQDNAFLITPLIGFFSILVAGTGIMVMNQNFLKKQSWNNIGDKFCVNIEKLIIEYFDEDDKKRKKYIVQKFHATLHSFIQFDKQTKRKLNSALKMQIEYRHLMDLDNKKFTMEKGDQITKALVSLAMIRSHLTE